MCFLKIYGKGKLLRITRKNRKRLRIFFFFQVLTDYQKSNPPYYNFFHNISIEFTSYDVGLGKHLSSTGAHYLNISIKLWDTIWLSYSNALWAKIFSKIGSYQTCTVQGFKMSHFGELPDVVLPKFAQKRQKLEQNSEDLVIFVKSPNLHYLALIFWHF